MGDLDLGAGSLFKRQKIDADEPTASTSTANYPPISRTDASAPSSPLVDTPDVQAPRQSQQQQQLAGPSRFVGAPVGLSPISVNPRQTGNPLLQYMRNCKKEFAADRTGPDFDVGNGACVLYLSIKYHKTHPDYIMARLTEMGKRYVTRVMLVVVNIEQPKDVLKELNMLCMQLDWTLILAHAVEEAAEYIEMMKLTEFKTDSLFREQETQRNKVKSKVPDILWSHHQSVNSSTAEALDTVIAMLTVHRSVNRTDAQQLLAQFGTLKAVAEASIDQLALVPGVGKHKARMIYEMFREPLLKEGGDVTEGRRIEDENSRD